MNGRQKIMKEPPLGSVVIDVTGSAWQRSPNGWSNSGSDGSWHYTWKRVVEQELYTFDRDFIPTEEWKTVLGDPRLPLIVYVPHEELITEDEDQAQNLTTSPSKPNNPLPKPHNAPFSSYNGTRAQRI